MRVLSRSLILSSALALGLSAVPQGDAAARGREARVRSGATHQQVTRTGPDGRSRTWQKDTSWQRGDGSAERHTTWTGPRGATAERHSVAQKTESGRIRTTTITRPDGSVVSWETTVERE